MANRFRVADCPTCGLPDWYRGQGDGIGSCDCPRCDCCGAGPDDCDCRKDWDGDPDDGWNDELNQPVDLLCNDETCPTRQARVTARAQQHRTAPKEPAP